ncbi:MAG: T9SS type A sorting domain-containing protein [Candidatus Zixiibacteriota bacterium]|nr:MAG: T9SS type A sorting domain-containing protein [candidate division Zixibacteria bacterium]
MKKIIVAAIIMAISSMATADDPGMPDTVIVDTAYAELGQSYVDVDIFAVTDEHVVYYNMPITWSQYAEYINPSEIFYSFPLNYWDDTFDSVFMDQQLIRMVGWTDDSIPIDLFLNTDSLRLRCWQIRFTIDSLAPPQVVTIDTTFDFINGSLLFGLEGGQVAFTPVFTPGAIYYGITTDVEEYNQNLPDDFTLLRNYPNPFNSSTTIEFNLPKETEVELSVYNILAQKVAVIFDEIKKACGHRATWDAGEFPSGIYFARLESEDYSKSIKMVLLK